MSLINYVRTQLPFPKIGACKLVYQTKDPVAAGARITILPDGRLEIDAPSEFTERYQNWTGELDISADYAPNVPPARTDRRLEFRLIVIRGVVDEVKVLADPGVDITDDDIAKAERDIAEIFN